MAEVLHNQEQYQETLNHSKAVYDKMKVILGSDNPSALATLSNMARMLDNQGQYEQAISHNKPFTINQKLFWDLTIHLH